VSSGDGMLSRWEVGFVRGITRKAEGAAWRSTPLLILMGKKSEKHFRQNEFFCFWGSEGACLFPIGDLGDLNSTESNFTSKRVYGDLSAISAVDCC
jgi:hypothetical protein